MLFRSGLFHFRNGAGHIRSLEGRGACHQHIRSGQSALSGIVLANSSVHLNEEGGAVFRAPFGGFFHLVQYGRHEGLAAEARHYGHDQQQVYFRQVRFYGFKGCGRVAKDDMVRGVTIAAGGFFGPQGRELRIPLADPKQNDKIEAFEYKGFKITNFEMESSALAGLSRLMGHKAMTVCMVIANRLIKEANTGYKNTIDTLIQTVLDRI